VAGSPPVGDCSRDASNAFHEPLAVAPARRRILVEPAAEHVTYDSHRCRYGCAHPPDACVAKLERSLRGARRLPCACRECGCRGARSAPARTRPQTLPSKGAFPARTGFAGTVRAGRINVCWCCRMRRWQSARVRDAPETNADRMRTRSALDRVNERRGAFKTERIQVPARTGFAGCGPRWEDRRFIVRRAASTKEGRKCSRVPVA